MNLILVILANIVLVLALFRLVTLLVAARRVRALCIHTGQTGEMHEILEPFLLDPSGPAYWIALAGVPALLVEWYLVAQGYFVFSLAVAAVAIALGGINGLRKVIEA